MRTAIRRRRSAQLRKGESTVLFPGRFQPLHCGHAEIIDMLAGRFNRVLVPIAMAQLSHMDRNPLTGGERYEMLAAYYREKGYDNVASFCIPYDCYLTTWIPYMQTLLPAFDVVYARNPVMRALFMDFGFRLVSPVRDRWTSGTTVRSLIASGGKWKELVPPSVYTFLIARRLDARIAEVMKDENS